MYSCALIRNIINMLCMVLACMWSGNLLAKTCTVSSSGIAFGVYDPTAAANLNTIGSLTVDCNGSIYVELSLGVGNGAGATFTLGRKMTRIGGGTLYYNLYANAARTQVLGDGTGGSVTLHINDHKTHSQPIWARIPARQVNALGGTYSDIVVATISY